MASYFMNAKKHVSLMFHKGALIEEESGLLLGEGNEGRTAKFTSLADMEAKTADLQFVVLKWVKMQDDLADK